MLEGMGFYDIVVALKASSAPLCLEAYRAIAGQCDYPLHLGITEAGAGEQGLVKSAVGLGALLMDGLGDTIRVSLTGDPVQEVGAAYSILRAAGVRMQGVEIISCPTCGRTCIDVEALSREVQEECGLPCVVGDLLGVHDVHFTGTAPTGRQEDFHGIHLVFAATVAPDAEPRVIEVDGTTDAVAWVPVADIEQGRIEVLDLVRAALEGADQ